MKLKTVIVEDEVVSRDILKNYLQKYCPAVQVVGEAGNVKEAVEAINAQQPDLVFLDVEMPYGNAFDLLDTLEDRTFEAIFVTAYDHYAKDALNQHAAYYITKPVSIDELIKAVNYVAEIKEKENTLQEKVLTPRVKEVNGKITIPQLDGFEVLNVADILFCKADDNYTEIHLSKQTILISKTLKYFEETLAQYPFARIHKSYLVNVNEVVKYKKGKGGSVVLSNGKELLVSSSRKHELLSFFE